MHDRIKSRTHPPIIRNEIRRATSFRRGVSLTFPSNGADNRWNDHSRVVTSPSRGKSNTSAVFAGGKYRDIKARKSP